MDENVADKILSFCSPCSGQHNVGVSVWNKCCNLLSEILECQSENTDTFLHIFVYNWFNKGINQEFAISNSYLQYNSGKSSGPPK